VISVTHDRSVRLQTLVSPNTWFKGLIMDGSKPEVSRHPLTLGSPKLRNWLGSLDYRAAVVVAVDDEAEIQSVVRDRERYPTPVRASGSRHSMTECVVNEGGTVVDMTRMNRILCIDARAKTITMQAGVLLIDAAKALERCGLQLYVNIELGNLTVGSGACCGTKDASYYSTTEHEYEYGQVASYVTGFKAVQADGEILVVDEQHNPQLLAAMRSSYGMLGIIYEVTMRVKQERAMAVQHVWYTLDEFARSVDRIVASNRSTMLYMFPFLDQIVVEHRYDGAAEISRNSPLWLTRNFVWKNVSPVAARLVSKLPSNRLRSILIDGWSHALRVLFRCLWSDGTSPSDQLIRYADQGDHRRYTFSIWAFDQREYPRVLREYFAFCKAHHARTGYRCDMLSVGYSVAEDRSSLFSYTRNGPALTLDPVSTHNPGWLEFLDAFNELCHRNGGKPLFNQTPGLTRKHVQAAFAPEIATFEAIRKQRDPDERFYPRYFKELFR
jgi:FAD/FMN-containing dehydrogenase